MNKRLLIIGAGGHGRVAADIALKMGKWDSISFLDDDERKKTSLKVEVIGGLDEAYYYFKESDFFVAIGDNGKRKTIQMQLESEEANIATLIHPSTVIGAETSVGVGTVIMAGVVINCCSIIGEGCIINTGTTIDHDNVIGNYTHISPGAHLAGSISVGNNVWIGIGSLIKNNVNIVDDCIIGAGAVVVKDITEKGTYIGVPASKFK